MITELVKLHYRNWNSFIIYLTRSRNVTKELQMKKLNIKRRLAKLFRKVYLITIFLSINQ